MNHCFPLSGNIQLISFIHSIFMDPLLLSHVTLRSFNAIIFSIYGVLFAYRAVIGSLYWRHNRHDSISNHQPHDCLFNRLFRRRSKKISKFRVTGLCAGNSPETGKFPAQMASNAANVSIWWRHHVYIIVCSLFGTKPLTKQCWLSTNENKHHNNHT